MVQTDVIRPRKIVHDIFHKRKYAYTIMEGLQSAQSEDYTHQTSRKWTIRMMLEIE